MNRSQTRLLLLAALACLVLCGCGRGPEPSTGLPASLGLEPPEDGPDKPSLLLDRPVGQLAAVQYLDWNDWASDSTFGATLTWWLATTVLGSLVWPLAFVVFSGLRDRGYLLARSLALLLVGYLTWLPASLGWLQNGLPLTLAGIALLTLLSGLLAWRHRNEIAAFLNARWHALLLGELVFGVTFLAFVGIRLFNPDLWQPWRGGEKAMDIAYLNACLRSPTFPPYDPYFAHGYLNYYYYGQLLMAVLVRITGIRSTVAFNLAIPTLFALTCSNAFSIAYTLAGRVLAKPERTGRPVSYGIVQGLWAVLCVAVLGNMASATQIIEHLGSANSSEFASRIPGLEAAVKAVLGARQVLLGRVQLAGFDYWAPSRVVGPTINEFPYWSFLFADLHPHMINVPFTLVVVALALNHVLCDAATRDGKTPTLDSPARPWQQIEWGQAARWAVWPVALGALWAINSWDWPAYAGLSGLVLLIDRVQSRGKRGVAPALLVALLLAASSLLLYLPFIRHYSALFVGVGWGLARGHTLPGEFLTVWGCQLFLVVSLLLVLALSQRPGGATLRHIRLTARYLPRLQRVDRLRALLVHREPWRTRLPRWGAIALAILAAWWAGQGHWVLAGTVPLVALSTALLVQTRISRERRFVLALVFTSLLLLVGVELFYLKDHLDGGDAWRMNTLFKFYFQVWVMLGIALGASLPELWQAAERWKSGWRWLWTPLFGLLLFAAGLYPVLGTQARVADRMPGERPPVGTLDGTAFMRVGTYYWPDRDNPIELRGDYEAIRWLQENVPGTPVLAEAPVWYYRDFGGRVSSYTGLPTLYNETHQGEQRYGWQTEPRQKMAHELYRTLVAKRTMEVIRQVQIEYIYLGPLEETLYPHAAGKFDQMVAQGQLSLVYRNDLVRIYQVE